jgi:NAD(P)-dependent dehydrogenase (short-subunit alcohol dehydrogenase family)
MRFQDQVVVVTGAARGIGAQAALRFAQEGARVVVNDLDPDAVAGAVRDIEQAGGRAIAASCDVSDQAAVQRVVAEVMRAAGHIDVLVNNAAIHGLSRSETLDAAHWRRTFAINVDGAFFWSQAVAVASMLPRRAGNIVNIASGAGLQAMPQSAAYVSAKHALIGLTRALAVDWGPYGLRVNAVCPGITWTDLARQGQAENPSLYAQRVQRIPLGYAATTDDQADAILFVASSQARSINGLVMNVDGGILAMSAGYSPQPPE